MAEPLRATFHVFRKREGGVLLGASLVFVAFAALLWGAYIWLNREAYSEVSGWIIDVARLSGVSGGPVDPNAIPPPPTGLFGVFGGLILVLIPHNILLASYEAACLRWMIRGEKPGLFGLTLGADTWRVWGTYWVWFGLNIAASFVVGILVLIVGVSMGGLGAAQPYEFWIRLGSNVVLTLLAVRLAPAAATSVGQRAFAFFKSWTVTRDRYLALLGSFLLLGLIYLIGYLLVYAACVAAMWPRIGADVSALIAEPSADAAWDAAATLLAPENLMYLLGSYLALAPVIVLVHLVYYGISARAVLAAFEEEKIEKSA